jgi:segregation and condensation protein B
MEKGELSSKTVEELDESNEKEHMKKVEAALFLAGRFLNLQDLVLMTDVNPLMLKEVLEKLIVKYSSDEFGMEIVKKDNMWKMDVKQEYVSMINKLATGSSEFSKSEQETLAVIAYKQPVKQSVLIKIRGNKAYEHVKNFTSMGLVIGKKIGHTKELRLSDDFFDYFHIQKKDLEDASKEEIEEVIEKVEDEGKSDNSGSNKNEGDGQKSMSSDESEESRDNITISTESEKQSDENVDDFNENVDNIKQ